MKLELRDVRHVYARGTPFEVEALRGVSLGWSLAAGAFLLAMRHWAEDRVARVLELAPAVAEDAGVRERRAGSRPHEQSRGSPVGAVPRGDGRKGLLDRRRG